MNHWRYDECGVAFYHDGIEKSNHDVVDALNAADARIVELENLVEVQRDDNCHLADMCRERDDRIAKLEIALAEALPYEISEKIRKGEGTYIPMPESSEAREK